MSNSWWVILIVILIAVCFLPWIFIHPAWSDTLNFSKTGDIGDTIGGITAPFIGGVSAILIFLALHQQVQQSVLTMVNGEMTTLEENSHSVPGIVESVKGSITTMDLNGKKYTIEGDNKIAQLTYFLAKFIIADTELRRLTKRRQQLLVTKMAYLFNGLYREQCEEIKKLVLEEGMSSSGNSEKFINTLAMATNAIKASSDRLSTKKITDKNGDA